MKLYEDDNIIVYSSQGRRDVIVVSFAHMDFPNSNGGYWGEKPLQALGYTTLGVVAKKNHWYPPSLMQPALERMREIARNYPEVITYGFSMGAYAAVKYSSCLCAKTVIALSPQASIDPQDDKFGIYRSFFDKEIHLASGIRGTDIGGNLYIIYDPYMKDDAWSASFIQENYPRARKLEAPRAQHETIDMFANTQALSVLIESCRSDDLRELRSLISARRKIAWRRVEAVTSYALSRNKNKAWHYILTNREKIGNYVISRLIEKHGNPTNT